MSLVGNLVCGNRWMMARGNIRDGTLDISGNKLIT